MYIWWKVSPDKQFYLLFYANYYTNFNCSPSINTTIKYIATNTVKVILGKTNLSTLIYPEMTAPVIPLIQQFVCDAFVDSLSDVPEFMKIWDREKLE